MKTVHLLRRGLTWYVRYYVPADLQPAYGRAEVVRTLQTREVAQARRLLPHALASIALEVEKAAASGRRDSARKAPAADYAAMLEEHRRRYQSGDRTAPADLVGALDSALEAEPDYWADTGGMSPEELAERAAVPADLAEAQAWIENPERRTLGEWMKVYLQHKQADGRKGRTIAMMQRYLTPLVSHFGARMDPDRIAKQAADAYVRDVVDKWTGADGALLSHTTRVQAITFAVGFFNWLADAGHVRVNPFAKMSRRLTGGREETERRQHFSDAELQALFTLPQPHPRFTAAALLGLFTGMRIEELAQLRANDCADGTMLVRGGKTASARRAVPVHPIIRPMVDKLRTTSQSGFLLDGLEVSGVDKQRSAALSKAVGRWFKVALPGTVAVFHSTRHNFITALQGLGTPESTIRQLVGHKNPGVTLGVYAHGLELEQLRKVVSEVKYGPVVDKLAKALAKAHPGNRGSSHRADFEPLRTEVAERPQAAPSEASSKPTKTPRKSRRKPNAQA